MRLFSACVAGACRCDNVTEKFDDVLIAYRSVTDRRTDRQTSCDSIVGGMHSIAR